MFHDNLDQLCKCNVGELCSQLTISAFMELQPWTKYLRKAVVFIWNSAAWEKFNFFFHQYYLIVFDSFFIVFDTKILFWEEGWALGYNSMNFWYFPDIS